MALLGSLSLLTACTTTTTVVATTPAAVAASSPQSDDDDFSQLIAQLRADLNRNTSRAGAGQKPLAASTAADAKSERDRAFSNRANALFAPLNGSSLQMPVVGISARNLYDSWGQPRDGGRRKHKGIDIFAPRGTPVVAVTGGVISYIGDQPKGGLCLWLTTDEGKSFYYAHLERWAAGLFEGMEVQSGDLLGYVGNTGNAKTTPPHLHFAVNDNDEMVNPYPILTRAAVVQRARVTHDSGNALGTR